MNFREAHEAAVLGDRVTCDRMGPGTFVDYQFAGLRINHAGGASSGYSATAEDRACEWRLFEPEAEATPGLYLQQFGRARRPDPKPDNVGNWTSEPLPATKPIPPKWPKKKDLPKWN